MTAATYIGLEDLDIGVIQCNDLLLWLVSRLLLV